MDEKIPDDVNASQPKAPQPANEDAKQFSQWMSEYGRPALIGLAVAGLVLLGISIWRGQKEKKATAAVQALFQGKSPEELQMLASADPEAPTAPLALASAAAEFYAQNRYDEAMEAYQRFLGLYPTNMLSADAAVGVAASQEALEDFEAAASSYEAFAAANPNSPLRPQAVMGAARCREQLGQFDEARTLYEDFIAANPESGWLPQAESGLLFLKKAERAKDLPPAAAPPEVVFDSPSASAQIAEENPAPAEEESAPATTEEAVAETLAVAPEAAPEAPAAVAETAPAVAEDKVAQEESMPRKKRASKKKPVEAAPVEEAGVDSPVAEEPAAE